MGITANSNCGHQFSRIIGTLVWGGLTVCVAVATLYDISHWIGGW